MNWIRTIIAAFSMFSRIPMPRVRWDEKSMRYMLCAFPLIGVVIGLLLWGWQWLANWLALGNFLYSAGFVLIPIAVTGGIHLDGFCDTVDALSSHAPMQKKLEILKDSRMGAFAAIGVGCYLILYTALAAELDKSGAAILLFSCGFVLERALSGFSVIAFPKAKKEGLVKTFEEAAAAKKSGVILLVIAAIIVGTMITIKPIYGAVLTAAAGIAYFYYYRMSKKQFGGITGDLAGFFLQVCEIVMLTALTVMQKWL